MKMPKDNFDRNVLLAMCFCAMVFIISISVMAAHLHEMATGAGELAADFKDGMKQPKH